MTQGHQLQCPDCGDRHDLNALGHVETFRCAGCGRALKVPLQVRAARAQSTPNTASDQVTPGEMLAPQRQRTRASMLASRQRSVVAWWLRLIVWVVAVPFGLAIVFGGAIKLKWVTKDELVQTFTGAGWDRFAPVAKLLPIAALIAATVVQVLVMWLERNAARRRAAESNAERGGSDGAQGHSRDSGIGAADAAPPSTPDVSAGDSRARGLERFNTR